MSAKYRYGHRSAKKRHILAVLLTVFLLLGAAGFFVYNDIRHSGTSSAEGQAQTVAQVLGDDSKKLIIDEVLFTMQLPRDWKEKAREDVPAAHTILWQATKKGQDNRSLELYIDTIPTTLPINRLLPVSPQGSGLGVGDISDNCATFTGGGSLDVSKATQNHDTAAKWAGVDFVCSLTNVVDNQIGTGSAGGVNQVTLTGSKGTHKYFFLYIDRNIQPDYSILEDAIQSFKVK